MPKDKINDADLLTLFHTLKAINNDNKETARTFIANLEYELQVKFNTLISEFFLILEEYL